MAPSLIGNRRPSRGAGEGNGHIGIRGGGDVVGDSRGDGGADVARGEEGVVTSLATAVVTATVVCNYCFKLMHDPRAVDRGDGLVRLPSLFALATQER